MARDNGGEDRRSAVWRRRNKQSQAPGDDFGSEAERLQLWDGAVGVAGKFDAMDAHDQ